MNQNCLNMTKEELLHKIKRQDAIIWDAQEAIREAKKEYLKDFPIKVNDRVKVIGGYDDGKIGYVKRIDVRGLYDNIYLEYIIHAENKNGECGKRKLGIGYNTKLIKI